MISFFHQQCVAGISAVKAICGQMAAIHVYPRIGQIFGAVQAFTVDVGVEMPQSAHFFFEISKSIAVEDLGTVADIGGTGDFQCGVGGSCPHRAADIEAHHHGGAAHDAGHLFANNRSGVCP